MSWLLLCLALLAGDDSAWKVDKVALVVQHSGGHMQQSTGIVSLLTRLLATRPETAQVSVIGFEREFTQLESSRFRRRATVLQLPTTDGETLRETITDMVFHGPSPIYDALILALADKPQRILLFSNGIDNASEASLDDAVQAATKAQVPVSVMYLIADPPLGGDTRLKKLAKSTGGHFIDLRAHDSWEQLLASLK